MKVIIMAGGKGSRISSIEKNIPKPMIKIVGMPVLEHEIACLKKYGLTDLIISVGYLGNIIMDYFGNGSNISPITGQSFGVNIEYFFEETPLGNAGALYKIKDNLKEDFLLLNADSIFDIDFGKFIAYHKQKGGLATLFTHPNSHPYDSAIIIANKDCAVTQWITKEDKHLNYYRNRVNAGIHILSPKLLDLNIETQKIDLDRQILKPLAGTGDMFVYDSSEYVKDMGTPERYSSVNKDFEEGIVQSKNLGISQKAIFLDRDGTINKFVGFLKNIEDFELIDGTSNAIKRINNSNYLVIVVTNQPVIARGEVSYEELQEIHNKMETLLGFEGAYVDAIYFCPHHPDKGYKGEIEKLKIECDCRKPKPGMLLKAAEDFNIDLNQSWMIGDDKKDIMAGKAVGCNTCLIGKDFFEQDVTADSLYDAIKKIL